jgi:hypothetical protein
VADVLYLGEPKHAFRRVQSNVVLKKPAENRPAVFNELVVVFRINDGVV